MTGDHRDDAAAGLSALDALFATEGTSDKPLTLNAWPGDRPAVLWRASEDVRPDLATVTRLLSISGRPERHDDHVVIMGTGAELGWPDRRLAAAVTARRAARFTVLVEVDGEDGGLAWRFRRPEGQPAVWHEPGFTLQLPLSSTGGRDTGPSLADRLLEAKAESASLDPLASAWRATVKNSTGQDGVGWWDAVPSRIRLDSAGEWRVVDHEVTTHANVRQLLLLGCVDLALDPRVTPTPSRTEVARRWASALALDPVGEEEWDEVVVRTAEIRGALETGERDTTRAAKAALRWELRLRAALEQTGSLPLTGDDALLESAARLVLAERDRADGAARDRDDARFVREVAVVAAHHDRVAVEEALGELDQARAEAHALTEGLEVEKAARRAAEERSAGLQGTLDALVASRSWRLTAPLRRISRGARQREPGADH